MESKKKKIILAVLIFLFSLVAIVAYAFNKYYKSNVLKNDFKTVIADSVDEDVENTDRINVLVLGMEHTRTDMIMVASFDPVAKTLNAISIPRDTFVQRAEYSNNYPDNTLKKINAVYEIPDESVERLANTVSDILGVPIHDYVMVDYKAVGDVTDAVGGVDVAIPFNMHYDDPWSDPPLHVHFTKGTTHLNGNNAIEFLRWRHNNDGSYGNEGDIGRVKRQQEFMKKILDKALNPTSLPKVIDVLFKNVKTSLGLAEVMGFVTDAVSMPKENIHFYQEVGEAAYFYGLWYFVNEPDKTKALMQKIMKNETILEEDTKTSQEFLDLIVKSPLSIIEKYYGGDTSYSSTNNNSSYNSNNTTNKYKNYNNTITTTTRQDRVRENNSYVNNNTTKRNTDKTIYNDVTNEEVNNSVTKNQDTTNNTTSNNNEVSTPKQPVKPAVQEPILPANEPVAPVDTPVVEENTEDSPVF